MEELRLAAIGAALVAALLLAAVFRELAPAAGIHGRGRWLLALGLGGGVVAFGAKLVLIAVVVMTPPSYLASPLEPPAFDSSRVPSGVAAARSEDEHRASPNYVWQALPESPAVRPGDTPALVALGRRLFHDTSLSRDGSVACASCHDLDRHAGADGRARSEGVGRQRGERNAPSVVNAALLARLFWDGRAASLEAQALGPLLNPAEMGMPSVTAIEARIASDASYRAAFRAAFGDDLDPGVDRIVAAIAAFERAQVSTRTAYDRFVRGDRQALDPAQQRGMALFANLGCVNCHAGAAFTVAATIGAQTSVATTAGAAAAPYRLFPAVPTRLDPSLRLTEDRGRAAPGDGVGVWRVPSLRNVASTGPYFHNGAVERLDDAVRIMVRAQIGLSTGTEPAPVAAPRWSPADRTMAAPGRTAVSDAEIADIVAFLQALSDER